jgi:hypothetical protein
VLFITCYYRHEIKEDKSVGPEEDTEYAISVYRILVDNPEGKESLGGT